MNKIKKQILIRCHPEINTSIFIRCLALTLITLSLGGCLTPRSMGRLPHARYVPGFGMPPTPERMTNPPVAPSFSYGTITKGANIRMGPGTNNSSIGTLSSGSSIKILDQQNDWHYVEATVNGQLTKGWVYSPLIQVNMQDHVTLQTNLKGAPTANLKVTPGQSNITYMGYTKEFLPVKQLLAQGQMDALSGRVSLNSGGSSFWTQDDEFLRSVEYGTLMLDQNKTDQSIKNYSTAERILESRESQSLVSSWIDSGSGWMGEVFGSGAVAPYEGEGYEKVLMLNYLSIAYLLQGERKAYNVARRSIDLQNIEKREFDAKRSKATEKLGEQEASLSKSGTSSRSSQQGIAAVFDAMNMKAKDIPSAYVNPFGFYVTGMIQEYESYQDRSLRDNARISYEKALDLNPGSPVLLQAVEDLKKPVPPSGKRLLHVVAADGFAPEKKVLVYNFRYSGLNIPMKLPIFEPGNSQVDRIEIQTNRGKRLAKLSPVADVEAICIRHQKDSEVFRNLRVALAFSSSAVEKTILNQFGILGNWVSDYHEKYKQPDTRSWMTLPATIQAARVFIPKKTKTIKLVTYSKSGKVLASKTIDLPDGKPNFIYARSIDNTLYAHSSQSLWLAEAF